MRWLVLLGAVVAFAAFAWATADYLLAGLLVGGTGAGHLFSWRLRRNVEPPVALLISLAAIIPVAVGYQDILALFSGGSLATLARLLAAVQAIASFNLATRRNLYDSLALSLTVLLLTGEIALSPLYVAFLAAFGLLAMGVLMVTHHASVRQAVIHVVPTGTPARLGLGTGLAASVFLAAVPVYVLLPQNHAVSDAGPLPSRLDLSGGWPLTPTDFSEGDWAPWAEFLPSRTEALEFAAGTTGPLDPRQYIQLGYIGDTSDEAVLYVRSPLASLWRAFTLDGYDGHGWVAASREVRLRIDNEGRLRFAEAPSAVRRGETYVQSYFLRVPQPSAVFTGYAPGWIALGSGGAASGLLTAKDNTDYLRRAMAYRVISPVPHADPQALRLDRADLSEPAYTASPAVSDRVRELAAQIVQGAATEYDKAARLERFLLSEYSYDLRVTPPGVGRDPVDYFLFEAQAGYCSQFATAMAVMGRLVGLPTRVAVGYAPGRYSSLTGTFDVRAQDAHAWVEVRFQKQGWVPFDPTPAPNSPWALGVADRSLALGLQHILREQFGGLLLGAPREALVALASLSQEAMLLVVLVVFGLLALAGIGLVLLKMRRERVRHAPADAPPYTMLPGQERQAMRQMYRQALAILERRGYPPKAAWLSLQEYRGTIDAWASTEVADSFAELTRYAASAFYDPRAFPPAALQTAHVSLQRLAMPSGRDGAGGFPALHINP
ncbi:MAG: transglutaminase domain-containing protein [Chloroflexi bacterium]|nr:transglutaminase domain-containing protein [Chloroflexota bacterium]